MAEQHYKETKAAKQAKSIGEYDSGYRFDLALCRKIFDEYDQDESGYLDIQELTELAEVLFQNAVCIYFFHFIALSPSVFCRRLRYTFYFSGLHQDVTAILLAGAVGLFSSRRSQAVFCSQEGGQSAFLHSVRMQM